MDQIVTYIKKGLGGPLQAHQTPIWWDSLPLIYGAWLAGGLGSAGILLKSIAKL
jgi:hypothetical protein